MVGFVLHINKNETYKNVFRDLLQPETSWAHVSTISSSSNMASLKVNVLSTNWNYKALEISNGLKREMDEHNLE